jgi:opacity protein-like surface antigen
MKTSIALAAAALALFAAGAAQAAELPVHGRNAAGLPGEVVFLEITYEYGDSFKADVEDLVVLYSSPALKFLTDVSTIGTTAARQSLDSYFAALKTFAQGHGGNVSWNPQPGEFRLSYYTDGTAGHARSGDVHLRAAFEIQAQTAPGDYRVSFGSDNFLHDPDGNEYTYPEAMQSLRVTVQSAVPEPAAALLLLSGLASVGWRVKRRRS